MGSRALDGLRVLDLATFIAAPFCCTLLGEFGAEVVKVERPGDGDDLRRLGRRPAGGPAAAQADIVAENFRPGTMERWNLGWPALYALNRGLIMVRISAFGQTGPARARHRVTSTAEETIAS